MANVTTAYGRDGRWVSNRPDTDGWRSAGWDGRSPWAGDPNGQFKNNLYLRIGSIENWRRLMGGAGRVRLFRALAAWIQAALNDSHHQPRYTSASQ
jgi:hypothetical protein